ncbi:MAG: zeta toxin family protein [Patescibacteria group bacterium]
MIDLKKSNYMESDEKIAEEAKNHIHILSKSKELYRSFASDEIYRPFGEPQTFFMAGSPGAGKTELSRRFVEENIKKISNPIVRIDADEIRKLCPGYNGSNSHIFQRAVSLGVDRLYDYALKKKFNVLLDSTFSNYEKAESNIRRAIEKGREVYIFYIYQEPIVAWEFTQKREKLEGRRITAEVFSTQFILAKENIKKVMEIFKGKIKLTVIKKDYNNNVEKTWMNVSGIDNYIKFDYTSESLCELIKNVKIE